MPERPLVNITMPTFNRLELTRQSIEALVRHTGQPFHLTVVDNASQDGTREYLRGLRDQGVIQTLLLLDRNMGVACAANAGWAAVPAPLYMKLDNDIAVNRDGWLDDLAAVLLRNPELAALSYPTRPYDEAVPVLLSAGDQAMQVPHCGGACILIRQDIHERLGFWCEDYGLYGEEDSDFGNRVTRAGLVNAYLPDFSAIRTVDAGTLSPYVDIKVRAARRRNLEQFLTNTWAYRTGLRPLYMPRKYTQQVIDGERVAFGLDKGYQRAAEAWNSHRKAVAETNREWIEDYIAGRR